MLLKDSDDSWESLTWVTEELSKEEGGNDFVLYFSRLFSKWKGWERRWRISIYQTLLVFSSLFRLDIKRTSLISFSFFVIFSWSLSLFIAVQIFYISLLLLVKMSLLFVKSQAKRHKEMVSCFPVPSSSPAGKRSVISWRRQSCGLDFYTSFCPFVSHERTGDDLSNETRDTSSV